tara:strand:+ start:258 stop:848 length:591 start_codon:yes stop_codon:yes gene_type:complete
MSVKSIDADGRLTTIFEKIDILDISAAVIREDIDELLASKITLTQGYFQESMEYTSLNSTLAYTTLDLSAGSYMMTVYPNINFISTDNTLLWNAASCNTDQFKITLTGVDYHLPEDPYDMDCIVTIPAGVGVDDRTTSVATNKKLGAMNFTFTLPADQSVAVSIKFSTLTQSRSTLVDLSPNSLDTELTFNWIKLA